MPTVLLQTFQYIVTDLSAYLTLKKYKQLNYACAFITHFIIYFERFISLYTFFKKQTRLCQLVQYAYISITIIAHNHNAYVLPT